MMTLSNESLMDIFAYANVEDLKFIFPTCKRFHGLEEHIIPAILQSHMVHLCNSEYTDDDDSSPGRTCVGDERWEHLPLNRQFTEMVMRKITKELHVPDRLESMVKYFDGMLQSNKCTCHQNDNNLLNTNIMGRVLGRFYTLSYKQDSSYFNNMDLAELLTGGGLSYLFDTAPRDMIFDMLLNTLGYDDDVQRPRQFPGLCIYTGSAGSMGLYYRMVNHWDYGPDFILVPFLDRPPLSDAAEKQRRKRNDQFVERLFTWPKRRLRQQQINRYYKRNKRHKGI